MKCRLPVPETGINFLVSGNYSRVQTSFSVQRLDKAGGSSGRNSSGLCGCGGLWLSILTDEKFFGGNLKDIRAARPLVDIPILRKDFIIDEYQLYQAKIVGADAVLLIAAALKPEKCNELVKKAHDLGLEVLLEIHSSEELTYINEKIDMVGINNRNLGTFFTDVENSFRLAGQLPQDAVLVSESGISDPQTVKRLQTAGFRGFLIGETFMRTTQPGNTLGNFLQAIQ